MKKISRRQLLTAAARILPAAAAARLGLRSLAEDNRPPDRSLTSPRNLLWYRQPAAEWTEANPIGNGSLGAMVFGGVEQEHLCLNEDTLWSGEPRNLQNHEAIHVLGQVRELLLDGQNTAAQALVDKYFLGPWNESYMPLGDLFIDCEHDGDASDYRRELDLSAGVVRIHYRIGQVRFTREIFASFPDKIIVLRFRCDRPRGLHLRATLSSQLHAQTKGQGARLTMDGRCPAHVEPSYENSPAPILWEDGSDGCGMRFQVQLRALSAGGTFSAEGSALRLRDADDVTFLLAAATSFNGFDKSPSKQGRDPGALCNRILEAAKEKSYPRLLAAHAADHGSLFERVELDLEPGAPSPDLPTDLRIRHYEPDSDPALAALYFQFGRYLLIASSRPGTQPANLQGIWTNSIRPDWSANWTLNCNAEINYWAAETANLSECHLPLFAMTEELRVDGRRTARNMYGCDGWVAHHNADLWRTTSPVGGSARWAIWKMGSGWLCYHLWEHYLFTQDEAFLRSAYPAMREAAVFYLGQMKPEQHGWLADYPATSFENAFRKPDGVVANVCLGPAMDTQIVHALLSNTFLAAQILNEDSALRLTLQAAIKQLPPMQVSPRNGQLQEWIDDWDPADPHNGQIGHEWGLMPGNQITPQQTPALAQALRKTIDSRQPWQYSTGSWVGSWTANAFARLHDAEAASSIVCRHLQKNVNPNMTANFDRVGGSTEFQIDGNLGITAAVAEMLLQSHSGEVLLLPALPRQWGTGYVRGLRARGGFILNLEWNGGKLASVLVRAGSDAPLRLRYKQSSVDLNCRAGAEYRFDGELRLVPTDGSREA